jgi:CRP-like cAMP-binding protein
MNVILAQESRMVRNFLREDLGATPYAAAHVHEAASAAELLQRLDLLGQEETLVLLDWNLPALDVPLLLSHLAGNRPADQVSVLLCVNSPQVPLAERAVARGARGYLVRPFTNEDLAAKVREIRDARPPSGPSGVLRDIATTVRVGEELPSLFTLPSTVLSQLFARARRVRHGAGSVVVFPGEHLTALSFVTSGEVEIVVPESADRIVRGAGECYAERAFVCGEPARVQVRALTPVEVASVAKESVVELARRHPALQDFLTLMLTRRPSREAEEGETEMSGTTASLPFSDLLQFLHSSRKTGVLVLENEAAAGRIYLERGEVLDARLAGEEPGEAAFAHLAALPRARFEFRNGTAPVARTVERSTMQLLMGCFLPSPDPVVQAG